MRTSTNFAGYMIFDNKLLWQLSTHVIGTNYKHVIKYVKEELEDFSRKTMENKKGMYSLKRHNYSFGGSSVT